MERNQPSEQQRFGQVKPQKESDQVRGADAAERGTSQETERKRENKGH